MPTLLYVGCLGYSNLGDEACLAGFESLMAGSLPDEWTLASINGYDFTGTEAFDALVLGGGTLLSPHGNLGDAAMIEARRRRAPYFIFGTGLESQDWEQLPEAAKLSEFRELVEGAVSIGLRGSLSKRYLADIGVPDERLEVIGDLAVALTGPRARAPARDRRLGVNVGTSFGRVYGGDERRMTDTLVDALESIAAEVDEIHLIPVWDRDLEIQREVARRLRTKARLVEIDALPSIEQLLSRLAYVDTVIAMKLHAGILAAVAGTPYVPWSYRPKVEDFAGEIGVREYVVRTDASADVLVASWRRLTAHAEEVRARLRGEVDSMRERLRSHAEKLVIDLHKYVG